MADPETGVLRYAFGLLREAKSVFTTVQGVVIAAVTTAAALVLFFAPSLERIESWRDRVNAAFSDYTRWWAIVPLLILFVYAIIKASHIKWKEQYDRAEDANDKTEKAERERDLFRIAATSSASAAHERTELVQLIATASTSSPETRLAMTLAARCDNIKEVSPLGTDEPSLRTAMSMVVDQQSLVIETLRENWRHWRSAPDGWAESINERPLHVWSAVSRVMEWRYPGDLPPQLGLFDKATHTADGGFLLQITPQNFAKVRQYTAQCVALIRREITHPDWPRKTEPDHGFVKHLQIVREGV